MDRIKNISMQILKKHKPLFTDDFEMNKLSLEKVAIIRSKQIRNKIAGYITYLIKQETKDKSPEIEESSENN